MNWCHGWRSAFGFGRGKERGPGAGSCSIPRFNQESFGALALSSSVWRRKQLIPAHQKHAEAAQGASPCCVFSQNMEKPSEAGAAPTVGHQPCGKGSRSRSAAAAALPWKGLVSVSPVLSLQIHPKYQPFLWELQRILLPPPETILRNCVVMAVGLQSPTTTALEDCSTTTLNSSAFGAKRGTS